MEALIGFAIGYYVGTRDGREGLQKAIAAFDAITKSAEFKNLMGQGLTMGGALSASWQTVPARCSAGACGQRKAAPESTSPTGGRLGVRTVGRVL